jgi:hypothetical protein
VESNNLTTRCNWIRVNTRISCTWLHRGRLGEAHNDYDHCISLLAQAITLPEAATTNMTDDVGGFDVWGAEDDDISRHSIAGTIPTFQSPKRSSKLFDDLEDSDADWGVQQAPFKKHDAEAHDYEEAVEDVEAFASTSSPIPAHSKAEAIELIDEGLNGVVHQLESTGFDDFDDSQFAQGGDKVDDDEFGDFGDFDEAEQSAFEEHDIPSEAGPSREWVSLPVFSVRCACLHLLNGMNLCRALSSLGKIAQGLL